MVDVVFVLIIFVLGEGKQMDYVAAELRLSAWECIQKARELNANGDKYAGACMPLIKD